MDTTNAAARSQWVLAAWTMLSVFLSRGVIGEPRLGSVVRTTTYGIVRGYVYTLFDGREVERYLGVPFAKPPVGVRRFELPEVPTKWSGIKNATTVSPACIQSLLHGFYIKSHDPSFDDRQSEDCLYLNIYVPRQVSAHKELPVLVHVHGGSNEEGMGAMFHADFLASEGNMIVVTFNYRLAAFGFLSAPHLGIPGNFGLHDQIMAFKWVQQNIASFGGDPAKVTVEGHSAGGVDVGLHILSPLSKGLFRSAILQSGSPLSYWAVHPQTDPSDTSKGPIHHLEDLGCHFPGDPHRTKLCLQQLDYKKLAKKVYWHEDGLYSFSATIDGTLVPEPPSERFMTMRTTRENILNGQTFMVGVVRDEGSLTAEVIMKSEIERKKTGKILSSEDLMNDESHIDPPDSFDDRLYRSFSAPKLKPFTEVDKMGDLALYVYKPWEDPLNVTANMIALSDLAGDVTFTAPAVKVANFLADPNSNNVYMYSFEHLSEKSVFPRWMGVPHGEDLFYLFGCPLTGHSKRNYTSADQDASRALIAFWSSFVRDGRPSAPNGSSTTSIHPYGANQSYVRIFHDPSSGGVRYKNERHLRARYSTFWNFLVPALVVPQGEPGLNNYVVVTWVLVGILCLVFMVCLILVLCIVYYKKKLSNRAYLKQSGTEDTGNMLL
ncbi:acetylcholinesterase [Aplysia californica]|uniref:Carboxylic ester hydrolase n=1 Tax=Aplysia californica TaxID=6500 RepID=A0ABM0K6E0_APLCA|nr:acetylcholinesterase [Aplysia californica]